MSALIGFLFLGLLVTIMVHQLCTTLNLHFHHLPRWLPVLLIMLVMLALICVPLESQAAVQVFRQR